MDVSPIQRVFVTGATGFVGRSVIRALLAKGVTPICLVRSAEKLFAQHREVDPARLVAVSGRLNDRRALANAASQSQAAIHLVGIIIARRLKGQTFHGTHVKGTRNVVDAVQKAGIKRYVHMSALGTRADAVSRYHQTKWQAEEYVRRSGLDWTIFRPSLIHGPDGEFMRLMKAFVCGLVPPVIPYFGDGRSKVQPVSVKDVAHCFVEALFRGDTTGKFFPMGGAKAYSWVELYNTCRALMPRAKKWKPLVSMPVGVAKLMAAVSGPPMALGELVVPSLSMFRFDAGQIQMAQEDSVCDPSNVENVFGIRMRSFEDELSAYSDQID